jgi:hypothetical protein
MNASQGETAVTTSALVVGGIYVYRKATEAAQGVTPTKRRHSAKSTAEGLVGVGEVLPVGTWITGAGVTFVTLAIINSVNPSLGGSLAILVATGTFLGNGAAVIADVNRGLGKGGQVAELAAAEGGTPQNTAGTVPVASNGNHPPAVHLTGTGQLH